MTFSFHLLKSSFLFVMLAACLYILLPYADAFAQENPQTIGQAAKHVSKQVFPLPKFIYAICYVIGVYFAARGLLALKGFIEKPDDTPITRPLSLLSVSALLIALPYTIDSVRNTWGLGSVGVESAAKTFSSTGKKAM